MDIIASHPPKLKKKTRRKDKRHTPFAAKLRSLVGYVSMNKAGKTVLRKPMGRPAWVDLYNRTGRHPDDVRKLPLKHIAPHEAGGKTLKVSATYGYETLIYFDFDTHERGSAEDVKLLAQVVHQHFPTVTEFVINERGGSGWLKVDTQNTADAEQYNKLVARLETYFRSFAEHAGLDIEAVEVKGRVYVPDLDKDGKCKSVKETGDQMKCPPPDMKYLDQSAVCATTFASPEFEPFPAPLAKEVNITAQKYIKGKQPKYGSFRSHLVTDEMIANLPKLEKFVAIKFKDRPTQARDWNITNRQFAEIMLTLYVLPENSDGSNPYRRHLEFISALHEDGTFESGWNHHRYKAVRDYLSQIGGIEWVDHTYHPGKSGEKGQACKWGLDVMLRHEIEWFFNEEIAPPTLIDTTNSYRGQNLRPKLVGTAEINKTMLPDELWEWMESYQMAA